jgi:hypothetical protein
MTERKKSTRKRGVLFTPQQLPLFPRHTSVVTGKAVRVRYFGPTANLPARYLVSINDGGRMGQTYSRHCLLLDPLNGGDDCAAAVAKHYVNEVLGWNVSLTGGTYANDWYFTTHQGVTP